MKRHPFVALFGPSALAILAGCAARPMLSTEGLPIPPSGAILLPGLELSFNSPTPTWLDNHRVLALGPEKGYRRTDGTVDDYGEDHAYVVDVNSGKRTLFPPLEPLFQRGRGTPVPGRPGSFTLHRPARLLALPGGRWLLAMRTGESQPWIACSTSGKATRRWSVPDDANWHPVGLKDGHRWAVATRSGGFRILLFDCENPKGDRSLAVEPGPGAETIVQTGWIAGNLGLLADGRILVKLGMPDGFRYVAIRMEEGRAVAEPFDHTEKNDEIGVHELAVSPDGTRLAY